MVNTEPGKRLGRIYIGNNYDEEKIGMIVAWLAIVPIRIEPKDYNLEVIGTCELFDALDDMESVPTYDMTIRWYQNYSGIKEIVLRRMGTHK